MASDSRRNFMGGGIASSSDSRAASSAGSGWITGFREVARQKLKKLVDVRWAYVEVTTDGLTRALVGPA